MRKYLLALLVMVSLTGCASSSQMVELNLQPSFNASTIGNNKPVLLQVIDARSANSNQYATAKIDPQQNVTQLITEQVSKGLVTNQFVIGNVNTAQANQLTVKIIQVDHGMASGLFGSNTETDVAATINATSSTGSYNKTYYAHSYSDNYLSGAADPSAQVNAALNQLLNNIFNDQALLQFLAK